MVPISSEDRRRWDRQVGALREIENDDLVTGADAEGLRPVVGRRLPVDSIDPDDDEHAAVLLHCRAQRLGLVRRRC